MKCADCKSTDIKSRKTYSHGKGSRGKTIRHCRQCHSTNIEEEAFKKKFQKRRN